MVDHIVKVAGMLALPDLEDETKKAINAYIRDGLKAPEVKQPVRAEDLQSLLNEYLNGGDAN
jgi:hypothetical protein